MSILIRAAAKVFSVLPAGLSTAIMLKFSPVLPLISSRHRTRFRLLKQLAGPNGTISYGPFAGMRYYKYAAGSQLLPKYAGTYELELRSVLDRIIELNPDIIVDVGSAEGYYVVGLARRLTAAKILAFDIDRTANSLCGRLAAANSVSDRVQLCGLCSPATLENAIFKAKRPLVICDVEGAEDKLLRPDETPSLSRSHILVELHDSQNAGVSTRIRERFDATHEIETIADAERHPSDFPPELNFTPQEQQLAMDEGRQARQDWFFMTPRAVSRPL